MVSVVNENQKRGKEYIVLVKNPYFSRVLPKHLFKDFCKYGKCGKYI